MEDQMITVTQGARTGPIGAQGLTDSTRTHRASILEKLGMRDRVELTRYAIRNGLVEP
jgi:DNA-binding NarL/FixJ family response regulator